MHVAPSQLMLLVFFFFQAEDGIRDYKVTGVQTCALPISAKSYTGGEKSSLPLNHGFTVCWSDESTSVRWPGMSERTWLVSTSSVSVSPAARHSASRQLPSATAAREAARASARHVGRDVLGSAVARSAARTRSR